MRRFLLILLFVSILPQISFAQSDDYWPFLEEGKRWVYDYYVRGEKKGEVVYYLSSVEKVGMENETISDVYVHFLDSTYYFATLDEMYSNRIKYIFIDSPNDCKSELLYDFSLKEGDGFLHLTGAWDKYYPIAWKLESTKEITIRGHKTRVQILGPAFNTNSISYVRSYPEKKFFFEGIGSLNGINPMEFVVSDNAYYFKGCYIGDELVATYEDLLAAIEEIEGASAVEEIKAERERIIKEGIYDLQGRSMGKDINALPHGIYIKDGKKIAR